MSYNASSVGYDVVCWIKTYDTVQWRAFVVVVLHSKESSEE